MFAEDRQAFLRNEDFAVPVIIGGNTKYGIFDNETYTADGGTVDVDLQQPTLLMDDSDIVGLTGGTVITVNGVAYVVRRFAPDGTGFTLLGLSKP